MPQPFICPLDHSFDLPAMYMHQLEWREHSFLTVRSDCVAYCIPMCQLSGFALCSESQNPKAPPELSSSRMRIRVAASGASAAADGARGGTSEPELLVAPGSDFATLARAVGESPTASGVRLRRLERSIAVSLEVLTRVALLLEG